MPYVGQKPADIISTAVDTVTGKFSGEVDAASLDISGNIDVDGTTNLDVTDIDGTLNVAGETTLQTHLNLGDSDEIKLGAGVDMRVFSDGDNAVLRADNGRVFIQTDTGINLTKTGNSETMLIATPDGAVDLYHNNAVKLATASTGVNVTGGIGLGGTGAANIISDYEEGSFTPTWSSYTPAGTSGKFVKVGNQVTVYTKLITGTADDASAVSITNLPFTISGDLGSGTLYHNTLGLRDMHIVTDLAANSTICRLHGVDSGADTTIKYVGTAPFLGGSSTLIWILFYQTI